MFLALAASTVLLVHSQQDDEVEPGPEEPVMASLQVTDLATSLPGTLSVRVTTGTELLANGGGTWLSDVMVRQGETVAEGDIVFALDGVDVLAAHTAFPLARALAVGAVGPDVLELERLLERLGLFEGTVDAEFTDTTASAVHKLGDSLHAAPTWRFDPAWLVHIPRRSVRVAEVSVSPGTPAPSLGAAWARLPSRVSSEPIQLAEDSRPQPGDSYVATIGDVELEIEVTEDGDVRVVDGQEAELRSVIEDAEQTSAEAGGPGNEGSDGGGTPAELEEVVRAPVALTPRDSSEAVVVPVAAVVTDNAGDSCIAIVDDTAVEWTRVDVIGSQPGVGAYLSSEGLTEGTTVSLDPDTPSDLTC